MMLQLQTLESLIAERVEASIEVKRQLVAQLEPVATAARALVRAYGSGKKALFFGNGGSAADAQHLAAEFVGKCCLERAALPALALTVDTSALTAIGNDYGYHFVFARQVEALGVAGDVAVGISTSGNSKNVIEAVRVARRRRLTTIGLTGSGGGVLKGEVDIWVPVPSQETGRIQEAHILIGHIWSELVERAVFDRPDIRSHAFEAGAARE